MLYNVQSSCIFGGAHRNQRLADVGDFLRWCGSDGPAVHYGGPQASAGVDLLPHMLCQITESRGVSGDPLVRPRRVVVVCDQSFRWGSSLKNNKQQQFMVDLLNY